MNYRMITFVLGWILLFESAFLLVPTLTALIYREAAVTAFLLSIAICLCASALLLATRPKNKDLHSRDGFVVVSLSWIVLSLFGALPFMFTGVTASFADAFFETVSGFTTTGSTIFKAVESLPKSVLMWRSFTHWVGGMGILVFVMAFLPLSGGKNMHLMKAESTGPSVSKLVPKIRTTALLLYVIYTAMTLLQFILLLCGGMTVFEAINTAFATAGTGGFGIRNDSMASFSPYLQVVTGVFMLLFSVNFASYFLVIKGKWKESLTCEVRTFLLVVTTAVAALTVNIFCFAKHLGYTLSEALRHAFFTVASIISTTGFATADFELWPYFSYGVIVLIMIIGACAGSTGGGIKVSRLVILAKSTLRELRAALHPRQVKKVTVDGKPVEESVVRSAFAFLFCYLGIFVISFLIISADNFDFLTNFTSVATTLGNVGPGLGGVGPTDNFSAFSPLSKLVFSFDMLAGRLELFPMLLLFTPATWRKNG